MHRMRWLFLAVIVIVALVTFAATTTTSPTTASPTTPAKPASAVPAEVQRGMNQFSGEAVKAHVRFLSSDLLEGRGPGTRGADLAMRSEERRVGKECRSR